MALTRAHLDTAPKRPDAPARSAGFQTCRIADFQVGKVLGITQFEGLETRDTADLSVSASLRRDRAGAKGEGGEVCATGRCQDAPH
jgi:hypothetical protein